MTSEVREIDLHTAGFPEGHPTVVAAAELLGSTPLTRPGRRPGPPGRTVPISSTRYLADLDRDPVSVRVLPLKRSASSADALSSARSFGTVLSQTSSPHLVELRSEVHLIPGELDAICWAEELVDGTDLHDDEPVLRSLTTPAGSHRFLTEIGSVAAAFHRLGALAFPHLAAIRVRPDGTLVLTSVRAAGRIWADAGPAYPDLGYPGMESPEDGPGGDAVPASDVYRLGLIAHLLLTRELPITWDVEHDPEGTRLRQELRTQQPTPTRQRRPDLPRALADVIDHCLHPDPTDRYPDATALLDALRS